MSIETGILTTKLFVPPLRLDLVPRPRLMEPLDAGLRPGHKLILVSAPAGFGKTTLLSAWIARLDRPVAWLSLDERDNDPARFWSHLIAALQTVPGLRESSVAEKLGAALQSPQTPPLEPMLTGLINVIAATTDPLLLVLDDYHLIEAQPIHAGMSFLLEHQPTHLHLAIATRKDPSLALSKLRARRQVTEIRAADLKFSPGETATFYNQMAGMDLTPEEVALLEARTEGWIAGLQMALYPLERQPDRSAFIAAFAGDDRQVVDYLAEEVLNQQSEDVRAFLLQTSILQRLHGPLCNALLADAAPRDSQEILEHLERSNLFVVPLDNKRQWYRYHHLFGDLLRQRLLRTQPQRVPELHRRASSWYEANGYIHEAVKHALADPDPSRAVRLVERHAMPMLYRAESRTTLGWFEALPDETVCARPMLCVQYAWALALADPRDAPDAVNQRLAAAERAVRDENVDPALRDRVRGNAASIRAFMLQRTVEADHDPRHVIALAQQAQALLPEEELGIRSVNGLGVGAAYLDLGNLPEALAAYEETFVMAMGGGNLYVAAYALINQALIAYYQGRLRRAAQICQRGIDEFSALLQHKVARLPAMGGVYIALGAILLERNQLDEAEEMLLKGLDLIRWTGEYASQVLGYKALVHLRQAQGDAPAAEKALDEMEKASPGEMAFIGALRIQNQIWRSGHDLTALAAAVRWAEEHQPDLNRAAELRGINAWEEMQQMAHLTWVRVQIVREEKLDPILAFLNRRSDLAETHGLYHRVIELSILQALAHEALGENDRALHALARALRLGEPEGYVRVFVDAGAPLARLLYQAATQNLTPHYAGRILSAFGETESIPTKPPPTQEEMIEPLSEREIEVLQLVAEGLTNREIAQRLFLSPHTIRAHTSNIYGKLNVHSRTAAVAKARELGVLPTH